MNIKPKLSPRLNELLPEVSAQPVWRNIASQHSPIMRIKPIAQSTGKRLRSSTENKTVLPGGSRKLCISVRKVIELWIETRAVISWVMPTTAFLMRQLIVASRLGRTEYQLLLMKISWWDRNVKIRYKCLLVIDEFLTEWFCVVCLHATTLKVDLASFCCNLYNYHKYLLAPYRSLMLTDFRANDATVSCCFYSLHLHALPWMQSPTIPPH